MDGNNEDKIEQQQHILNYCFSALEYIRNCDAEMFKRAKEYAEDQTGVEIDNFELADKTDAYEVDEEGDDLYGFIDDDEDEENE